MYQTSDRLEDIKLRGVQDAAMQLTALWTSFASRDNEVIAGIFADYRANAEYPDFTFAVMYPRSWSAERIRMDLFAQIALRKAQHKALIRRSKV